MYLSASKEDAVGLYIVNYFFVMLAIRFNRTGKKNHASFRIVLQEHTKAPGKRHVEILGSYDPHKKTTVLKKERILYWIGQGAQASPVVTNLLIREGVIERKKIAKKMPRPVVKEESAPEPPATEAVAEEAVKTEEVGSAVSESVVTAEEPVVAETSGESLGEASVSPVVSGAEQTEASVTEEVKEATV